MVNLGDRARDKITGFVGIVVGRTEWLYGCQRLALKSEELKDGKTLDAEWFDEPQVELVDAAAVRPEWAKATTLGALHGPEAVIPATGGPSRGEEVK